MANKDYYQILGVPKNSSQEDIKQAYRKLAREHHPDMAKAENKAAAEIRFKEINEAYQALGDPQKRKNYDQFGSAAGPQGFGGFGNAGQGGQGAGGQWGPFSYSYTGNGEGFEGFDPFDVFEDFFGFRGFGGQRQPKRGKSLHYEMEIDFADAVHGAEKTVQVETGPLTVKIPAGINDGTEMRFTGKGHPGPNNTPNGDLFITFRVPLPKPFQRAGNSLVVITDLDFITAALGGELEIPVVDVSRRDGIGSTRLKIPAGTQYGTQFRIKGKGFPQMNRGSQGDVIVQVLVVVPKKLNKKQKELLEEYNAL
ncbi:MAG TPA: DnaJ C-terminal domain-containing protein [Candidatus Saccharimonadales bacterium]|nr:DnaJ C-terminal domain-containing protein [Candidatus Saccharimonadales bacterium]